MKTRGEVARFVEHQLKNDCPLEKGRRIHYGKQDLRVLLDFIYGGPPKVDREKVK